MEQQLAASIQSSLALGLHDNARFLAERLVAAAPTEVRASSGKTHARACATATACAGAEHAGAQQAIAAAAAVCASLRLRGAQSHKYLLASCYRHCNQGYRAVQLLKGAWGA